MTGLKFTYGNSNAETSVEVISKLVKNSSIPDNELSRNLGLFLSPASLGRILFMDHLFKKIIKVQGVVAEFGCRYGQNTNLFNNLREIYEPFNRLRKIYAFDTFEGFPMVDDEDGKKVDKGDYSVPKNCFDELKQIQEAMRGFSSMRHISLSEIIVGDVTETLPKFIEQKPSTIFALCYFDLDIYRPTKACLEIVYDRMPKGGIIAFDELNDSDTPGETLAYFEVLGKENLTIRRFPQSARTSYIIKGR